MNLYLKIFIGFWLSMIAIISSWLLAAQYVDDYPQQIATSETGRGAGLQRPGGPPPRHMFRIYYGLQNLEQDQLQSWIGQQEREHSLKILLLDRDGNDVFGRELQDGTAEVIEKLGRFRRRANLHRDDYSLFAQRLHRQEWGPMTMVVAAYPPTSPIVKLLTEYLWLRLLLAVIISGLISYAVSRYLTHPLKALQSASREFAEGKLTTRIEVPATGGDEAVELARDFNTMAEQLQLRMQEQKRLLHDVSHELRTPLARLRVALALAQHDPAESAAVLLRIERETERLDELIGQLLQVPEQNLPLEDSIDLKALLEQLTEDAQFEGQSRSITVRLTTACNEALCQTHGDLLLKALENVIRNALHYSPARGEVSIALSQHDQTWRITITDSGPGVPEQDLERIFEMFYRVDSARQRETGGYGLGLAIAQRAIQQHEGFITARNTDSGLEIAISLPFSAAHGEAA